MPNTPRNVLITGASAGIGAATAVLCAQKGYDVGIGFLSDEAGAQATRRAVEAEGRRAMLLPGDTSRPEDLQGIFEKFDAFGPLHGFVNNAGVVDIAARVEEFEAERVARIMAINVTGPILAAGLAVKRMATRYGHQGGVIINLSSVAALMASPHQYVDYAASKSAIDTLTKGLALENADQGIRVCGVRPGIIDTQIHAKGGQPDRARELASIVPMKRAGTAREVAQAILWLMSDDASYATGTTIDIAGGR